MKSTKLYVNTLPIIIVLVLIGTGGYFLFGQDITGIVKQDSDPKITRIDQFPVRIDTTDEREKFRTVITSEEELAQFMENVDPEGTINLRDSFNFNKRVLVGVATETLEGELNKYRIKRVEKNSDKEELDVIQELIVPLRECPEEEAETDTERRSILVDLIQLEKTDWEIDFSLEKRKLPCGEI